MPKITSLDELISRFDAASPSNQAGILKSMDIDTAEFEKFATWGESDTGYSRNCITRNEAFEFILLCWDKGASTAIHSHSGQNCWVYQVAGEVLERRYEEGKDKLKLTQEMKLTEGRLTFMHDRMGFHQLENTSANKAMTLHIYAKPIDRCMVYDEESAQFTSQELEYHNSPEVMN